MVFFTKKDFALKEMLFKHCLALRRKKNVTRHVLMNQLKNVISLVLGEQTMTKLGSVFFLKVKLVRQITIRSMTPSQPLRDFHRESLMSAHIVCIMWEIRLKEMLVRQLVIRIHVFSSQK
jgi:hypothetical protein